MVTIRTHDAGDRLVSLENKRGTSTISAFAYTINAVGNRTQMVTLEGTTTFAYDALNRLTSVTYPGPETQTYSYDAVGNRLTKNAESYSYDDANQMLMGAGVSYSYDASGNQASRGSDMFTWDHENRMVQATIGGVTSTYTYNGDGIRMSRTVSGKTTSYTWDLAAALPVVLQDGSKTYVYGRGLISTTDGSGTQTYRLSDGLGSTANIIDSNGNVLTSYTYDVFGAVRSQTAASDNYWLFSGEQRDVDSGYDYLRARYYDRAIGRFLASDPLKGGLRLRGQQPGKSQRPDRALRDLSLERGVAG